MPEMQAPELNFNFNPASANVTHLELQTFFSKVEFHQPNASVPFSTATGFMQVIIPLRWDDSFVSSEGRLPLSSKQCTGSWNEILPEMHGTIGRTVLFDPISGPHLWHSKSMEQQLSRPRRSRSGTRRRKHHIAPGSYPQGTTGTSQALENSMFWTKWGTPANVPTEVHHSKSWDHLSVVQCRPLPPRHPFFSRPSSIECR